MYLIFLISLFLLSFFYSKLNKHSFPDSHHSRDDTNSQFNIIWIDIFIKKFFQRILRNNESKLNFKKIKNSFSWIKRWSFFLSHTNYLQSSSVKNANCKAIREDSVRLFQAGSFLDYPLQVYWFQWLFICFQIVKRNEINFNILWILLGLKK